MNYSATLSWSSSSTLIGDKILLPSSVLSSLSDSASATASPFVFEISNPRNRRKIYCGVKEFTAEEGSVIVPPWIATSLDLDPDLDQVVSTKSKQLPKATYAQLRPIAIDYLEITDIRATLESYLRANHTCLTLSELLTINVHTFASSPSSPTKAYTFVVSKLEPDSPEKACIIIDTDITVDIVPLEEDEQKLKIMYEQHKKGIQSREPLLLPSVEKVDSNESLAEAGGVVAKDEWRYYKIQTSPSKPYQQIHIQMSSGDINIFLHDTIDHPSVFDNTFFNVDYGSRVFNYTSFSPLNNESSSLEEQTSELTPFFYIAVQGYEESSTYMITIHSSDRQFSDRKDTLRADVKEADSANADNEKCDNCGVWIPKRTIAMHSAFCYRHNVKCKVCGKVMKKEDVNTHQHCPLCDEALHPDHIAKHNNYFHPNQPFTCPCSETFNSLSSLAAHRRSVCPVRLILCRFCHILTPAGPPSTDPKDYMDGITTEHESLCSSRTIDCQICNRSVRIRDVKVHMRMHRVERKNKKTGMVVCRNRMCSNWIQRDRRNLLGLCGTCFSPFWNSRDDPGNQVMIKRIVHAYFTQLNEGCKQDWCWNQVTALRITFFTFPLFVGRN
ncbi:ubiquitin fusion degradation protein UFD1-domain-containing protein [Paraphysoderma sedebokerense]|nr:ubiquitin fusion degradation protein UFD1-domain-containing protein [Paraphysoderma sedebokerense]